MKRGLILYVLFIIAAVLIINSIYAQESAINYKQLIAKCSEALKQARSYNVKMEYKNVFTINSQENKSNSAELNIAFISPDRFKVTQVMNGGKDERSWDGWIVTGKDYYDFMPVFGWRKKNDDIGRMTMCKAYSPEGIIEHLKSIEREYRRGSVSSAAKDGIEYFVIKYFFGGESVNIESLPPELRDSKISGTYEIWIDKNDYLPLKQSQEISYYSNEQNKGTSSTNTNYSLYNDDKTKIDEPVPGNKVF